MQLEFQLSLGADSSGQDFQFLTDPSKLGQPGATTFSLTGTGGSGDLSNVVGGGTAPNPDIGGPSNLAFASTTGGAPFILVPASDVQYSITPAADGSGQQDVTFNLASAWNTVKNVAIDSFDGASLTMKNWVEVHLDMTHNAAGSADTLDQSVDIEGAKRGSIAVGDGNDTIHLGLDSNGSLGDNSFAITAGNGDNTISVGDADHHYAADGLYFDAKAGATIPENIPVYDQAWSSVSVAVGNGSNGIELDGVYAHANVTAGTGGTDLTITDPGNHWNGIVTTMTANLAGGANTIEMVDAYTHTNITTGDGADTIDIHQSTRGDAPAGQDITLDLGDGAKETTITGNFQSINYTAGNGADDFTFTGKANVTIHAGNGANNIIAGWGHADITLGSGESKVEVGGIAGEQGGTFNIHAGTGQTDIALYQTDAAGHAAIWQQATIDHFNLGAGDELVAFGATKGAVNHESWTAGTDGIERVGNDLTIHFDGAKNDGIVTLTNFFTDNASHLSADELAGALTNKTATEIMHQVLHDGFSDQGWSDSEAGAQPDHVHLSAATAHEFMSF
ncbi:MAG TPA: hypothetical protein VM689_17725 [Aliidongia sp.]|nr:hypothetical protein [Aliidongia sp.]